jgi:hypothetical protein
MKYKAFAKRERFNHEVERFSNKEKFSHEVKRFCQGGEV